MKKFIFAIPFLTLAACGGVSSGSVGGMSDGKTITEEAADPGAFSGVTLAGSDKVIFTIGNDYSIRAEGDAKAVERLRYKLKDGTLSIARESGYMGWGGGDGSATIYVSAPALSAANISGSGDLQADRLSGDDAQLGVTGSGKLTITNITAGNLSAKITGSGDMLLSGTVKALDARITGSGKLSGKGLNAKKATMKVTGSGDAIISSDGTVDARTTGSGDIRVHGSAKCTSKTSGSGEIMCG